MIAGVGPVVAATECAVSVNYVFARDDGSFYVVYTNGGSGVIGISDPDYKTTVALTTAAMLSDKQVDVRYAENGASCTAGGLYITGLRFYK